MKILLKDINIRLSYTEWIARVHASPLAAVLDIICINNWLVRHGLMFHYLAHGLRTPERPGDFFKWIKRHVCVYCRNFSPERLQRCPCNKRNFYCNVHCQAADWAYHKRANMHKLYEREGENTEEALPRFYPEAMCNFESELLMITGTVDIGRMLGKNMHISYSYRQNQDIEWC